MQRETRYAVLLVGSAAQAAQATLAGTPLPLDILSATTDEDAQRLLRKHNNIVVVVLSDGHIVSLAALLGTRIVEHGSMLDRVIALNYNPTMLIPGTSHVKNCVSSVKSGFGNLVHMITQSIEYTQASATPLATEDTH